MGVGASAVSVGITVEVGGTGVRVGAAIVGKGSVAGAEVQADNKTITINRQQRFFPSFI